MNMTTEDQEKHREEGEGLYISPIKKEMADPQDQSARLSDAAAPYEIGASQYANTIVDDTADTTIYLLTTQSKIHDCVPQNDTVNDILKKVSAFDWQA